MMELTPEPGPAVNWRDDAACARADPDLFFPVSATGLALSQIDEAKRVCQGCPARTPCLEWALEHGVAAGIWGGATDEERRAMRQRLTHSQPAKGDPPCASETIR